MRGLLVVSPYEVIMLLALAATTIVICGGIQYTPDVLNSKPFPTTAEQCKNQLVAACKAADVLPSKNGPPCKTGNSAKKIKFKEGNGCRGRCENGGLIIIKPVVGR
jgi:hypothetical protein